MDAAPHVGTDSAIASLAQQAAGSANAHRYRLTTLYYSAGYFSTQQAIDFDALRAAIDLSDVDRDWLLAAWLTAASRIINSPGHTAQFLRPTSDANWKRIRRQWSRSVWETFTAALEIIEPVGSSSWRQGNRVSTADATVAIQDPDFDSVDLVYADPPYTKDHYSRFYHVYETMYLYDFPESRGAGRYRDDRVASAYSIKTKAVEAFDDLFRMVAERSLPLILSYPADGLLTEVADVRELLSNSFRSVRTVEVDVNHSTLGGSKGPTTKPTRENLYVCRA